MSLIDSESESYIEIYVTSNLTDYSINVKLSLFENQGSCCFSMDVHSGMKFC
jgi:hypothetical protein